MITLFIICMIAVFGRLLGFAIRLSWGLAKVIVSLILLPAALVAAFSYGLIELAFPVLAIIGLCSLFKANRIESCKSSRG